MSSQSDAHFPQVWLGEVHKLVDTVDAILLELRDVPLHLDRRQPIFHRLALQGVGGTRVGGVAQSLRSTFWWAKKKRIISLELLAAIRSSHLKQRYVHIHRQLTIQC